MSICVVVADSSKARILMAESGSSPLVDERDYIHAESRLREQDLVSDGSGSESDSGGLGKHSMGHEKAAHQKEAETFAHELCDEIDKLRRTRDLRKIYLVASPKFLGALLGIVMGVALSFMIQYPCIKVDLLFTPFEKIVRN